MKAKLRMKALWGAVAFAAILSLKAAEQPQGGQANPPQANQTHQIDMRTMQHMEEMDSMAKSMKSMADVCRMMMEKEMRSAPLKIGAIIGVGSLFIIALILFIVLEIQWIRFWSVRVRTERMKFTGPKSP